MVACSQSFVKRPAPGRACACDVRCQHGYVTTATDVARHILGHRYSGIRCMATTRVSAELAIKPCDICGWLVDRLAPSVPLVVARCYCLFAFYAEAIGVSSEGGLGQTESLRHNVHYAFIVTLSGTKEAPCMLSGAIAGLCYCHIKDSNMQRTLGAGCLRC